MTEQMQRYSLAETGDGDALVYDRQTRTYVRTVAGGLYYAPVENAQWTVDTMNRTAQVAPEAAPIAREEEPPEPEDRDRPESAPIRPNPVALLHVMPSREVLMTMEQADEPEPKPEPKPEPGLESAYDRDVRYARLYGTAKGSLTVAQIRTVGIEALINSLRTGGVPLKDALNEIESSVTELRLYLAKAGMND